MLKISLVSAQSLNSVVWNFNCPELKQKTTETSGPEKDILSAIAAISCVKNSSEIESLFKSNSFPQYLEKDLIRYAQTLREKKFSSDHHLQQFLLLKELQGFELNMGNRKELKNKIETLIRLSSEKKNQAIKKEAELILWSYFPATNPTPPKEEMQSVGRDFEKDFQNSKAMDIYKKILSNSKLPANERLEVWKNIVRLKRKTHSKKDQLIEQQKFIDWLQQNSKEVDNWENSYFDEILRLANFYWNTGEREKANATFQTLLSSTNVPDRYKLDSLKSLALMNRDQDIEKTISYYQQMLPLEAAAAKFNFIGFQQAGEFFYQQKKYSDAIKFFELAQKYGTVLAKERTLFWKGLSLIRTKKLKKAKENFELLSGMDPMGFYGHLSRVLLGKTNNLEQNSKSELKEIPGLEILKALNFQQSQRFMLLEKYNRGELSNFELISHLQRQGFNSESIEHYFSLEENVRISLVHEHPAVAYPTPLLSLVKELAQKSKVPTALIYAIMRQESLFDPNALSPADAIGLLQLISGTGTHMAQRKKIKFKRNDLFDPEKNILLGIEYLRFLMNMFNGELIPMVASYNAGPTHVKRWLKADLLNKSDPYSQLEFAEGIPFNETRDYLIKVFRNYTNYCLIYKFEDCKKDLKEIYKLKSINWK